MAPKGGANETVVDGLKQVFTQVASLMMLPDSAQHMGFLTQLMQGLQGYVLQKAQAATGQPMPGGPPAAGPGGPPPAAGPAGGSGGPPGAGGPMRAPTPGPGAADEIRRMLATTGAGP